MEVIDGGGAVAQQRGVGVQALRRAEQLQGLVEHVRAEVVQQAAARRGRFAPALLDVGAETVEVRLEAAYAAQRAAAEQRLQGQEIGVPAAVVVNAEHAAVFPGAGDQGFRLGAADGEGLVDDHVLAGQQGGVRQGEVGLVRRGDHHQFDGRVGVQLRRVGVDGGGRPVLVHQLGLARGDRRQFQRVDRRQYRGVEGRAGEAVAHQSSLNFLHGILARVVSP